MENQEWSLEVTDLACFQPLTARSTLPQIQIIKPWPLVSKKLKYKAREITASYLLSQRNLSEQLQLGILLMVNVTCLSIPLTLAKKISQFFFPSLYFMYFRGGKKTIHFNHVCSMASQQVIIHMAIHDRLAHSSLKWDIFDNTRTIINTTSGCMCGKEAQRELARGDKIIVLVKQLASYLSIYPSPAGASNGIGISPQVISRPWQVRVGEGPDPPPTLGLSRPVPPHRPLRSHHPGRFLCRRACQDRSKSAIVFITITRTKLF